MKTLAILLVLVISAVSAGRLDATEFFGGGSNGFGGAVGQGSLTLTDDGTTITGTITKGPGAFSDNLVLYIDSQAGGFADTSGFADDADDLRRAISGVDVALANRSVLSFPTSFTPDFAIALGPSSAGFDGLWSLANGGANSLVLISSVNLTPTGDANAATYTFSFAASQIGLAPNSGAYFKILGSYISGNGLRSNEALPGFVFGTQGWFPFGSFSPGVHVLQGQGPVVTNTNDAGAGSLREAILTAGSGVTITFDPALSGQTIALTGPELEVAENLTIDASALTARPVIDGVLRGGRIFVVPSGANVQLDSLVVSQGTSGPATGGGIRNSGFLTLNRSIISNNSAALSSGGGIGNFGEMYINDCIISNNASADNPPLSSDPGGGISNHGTLTVLRTGFSNNNGGPAGGAIENAGTLNLDQCTFTANTARAGGAIINTSGRTLDMTGCTLTGNTADNLGGGICNDDGSLTVRNSNFASNQALDEIGSPGNGGGIFNRGQLLVVRSGFSGNSANGGAGIYNAAPLGSETMTLEQCTLSGNSAVFGGGGIINEGTATLDQSTLSGNLVTVDSGGGLGAGIYNPGVLTINQSTVSGNQFIPGPFTGDIGGGIYNNGTLTVSNSIVAANSASSAVDLFNGGVLSFLDANLVQGIFDIGLTTGPAPLAAAPQLAPLGDFGGATLTMPPLPGSPAIDAAPTTGFSFDQRDAPRVNGPFPDLGAAESFAFSLLELEDSDNDGIDDRLEPAYPGLTVGVDDSAVDSDGDGSTDAEELRNMTDPDDSTDFFRILSFTPATGFDPGTNPLFDITFNTFPGLFYHLEENQTLEEFEFLPGSRLLATGTSHSMQVLLDSGRSFVRASRGTPSVRWATSVIGFSSEYSSDAWSAAQTLGQPDIYPQYGDISSAWASQNPDDNQEFLELAFDDPEPVIAVSIYETYSPGAVSKVSVRNSNTGAWTEVWTGTAAPAPEVARVFTVTFPETAFPVDAVRLDIDSPAVPSWNEIDAVSISR